MNSVVDDLPLATRIRIRLVLLQCSQEGGRTCQPPCLCAMVCEVRALPKNLLAFKLPGVAMPTKLAFECSSLMQAVRKVCTGARANLSWLCVTVERCFVG